MQPIEFSLANLWGELDLLNSIEFGAQFCVIERRIELNSVEFDQLYNSGEIERAQYMLC